VVFQGLAGTGRPFFSGKKSIEEFYVNRVSSVFPASGVDAGGG
jgi:hypothetical protein